MADMVRGRAPSQKNLPEYVLDYMIIHETGWSHEYVKSMNPKDRRAFNVMAQFTFNAKLQQRGVF